MEIVSWLLTGCLFHRYTDATSKYESVMKTEPSVAEYTVRSKERICHCFSKVTADAPRQGTAATWT